MKIFAAALAMTAFMAGPGPSAQLSAPKNIPEVPSGFAVCGERACIMNLRDVDASKQRLAAQAAAIEELHQAAQRQAEYIDRLQQRLNACQPPARVRVVPPGTVRS